MTYDGFGRMKTRHYPIEDAQTETTWNYNLDDSIYQIIDPRGAITDFTYDNRGLTTQIAYTPVTNVPDSPTVTYSYDNLGNRITADVAGIIDTEYTYDSLSRLTKERLKFDELGSTNFDVDHTYNLTGGLASVTDPFGYTVNYAQDKTGRMSSVSGAALAQHSNGPFADNIQYRAFGSTKRIDYKLPSSATAIVKMGYNDGLLVDHFEATEPGSTVDFAAKADFSYLADGRLSAKDDDIRDAFDRTNKYDYAGRLSFNQFGIDIVTSKRVYEQTASYDGFSNLTARATTYWDEQNDMDVEFTNGRITSDYTVVYDAAGNIVSKGTGATLRTDVFDASGRRYSSKDRWASSGGQGATVNERQTDHISDADGRPIIEKLGSRQFSPNPGTLTMAVYKYQVWSTVLGKAVATMDPSGNQIENRVYAGGVLLATALGRSTTGTSSDDSISFFASDPVTDTKVTYFYNNSTSNFVNEEKEPFGQNVSSTDPYIEEWNNYGQVLNGAQDPEWQCMIPKEVYGGFLGMPTHCQREQLEDANFYDIHPWSEKSLPYEPMSVPDKIESIPGMDVLFSASENVLAFANSSSDKKPKKKRKKNSASAVKKGELAKVQSYPASSDFIDVGVDVSNGSIIGKFNRMRDFVVNNVQFVGNSSAFAMRNREALISRFTWLVGLRACNDLFKKELGISPYQLIKSRGLYLTDYESLNSPEIAVSLGISNSDREGLLKHGRTGGGFASTTDELSIGVVTIFNGDRIEVSWFWRQLGKIPGSGQAPGTTEEILNEAVPHESFHGAGKKPEPFGSGQHDLAGWAPYGQLFNACATPGSRRVF